MGIMAADTSEFVTRSPLFRGACYRVSGHRVAPLDAWRQYLMTTIAEIVDRFAEHEFFIGGMRIMTNDTTRATDNVVNVG
jgi:hypothetical protein